MNRRWSTTALVCLPVVVVVSGCASVLGSGPADPSDIAAKAEPQGIAPDLVYVTEIDGFEPNPMSVGVLGNDGFSAMYSGEVDGGFGTVMLTSWHSEDPASDPAAEPCADLADTSGPTLSCTVSPADDVVVLLAGDNVDAALLRDAGAAVRVPTSEELDVLFSDAPPPLTGDPVERGDLPEVGDGAPRDAPGAGG